MKNLLFFVPLLCSALWGQTPFYNQSNILRDYQSSNQQSLIRFGIHASDSLNAGINRGCKPLFDHKCLLNYQDPSCKLGLSPLLNLNIGTKNELQHNIYQNSRGLILTGSTPNFTFTSYLAENQGRFSGHESQFISSRGEYYPITNGYNQQNGSIPGGARTKPFKNGGFDYFFARGLGAFKASPKLTLFAGNTPIFIGNGHRSLLLSDHINFPFVAGKILIGKRLNYSVIKGRLFDLIRKPLYPGVESSYLSKGFSHQSLTCDFLKFSLSLSSQSIWNMGDSVKHERINPLFFIPIPLLELISKANTMMGLNLTYRPTPVILIYGQWLGRGFTQSEQGKQLGVAFVPKPSNPRWALSVRLEYNQIGQALYGSNYQGSFSHNHLPLGSLIGNGTQEFVFKMNTNYKRWYVYQHWQFFRRKDAANILFKPPSPSVNQTEVFQGFMEAGWVIHKLTNSSVFVHFNFRYENSLPGLGQLRVGIKSRLYEQPQDY